MARSFSGQDAKRLRQYYLQLTADYGKYQNDVNGYWHALQGLVNDAKAAKAKSSVANEYVDVIAHEGKGQLANTLRAAGYTTLEAARIRCRDISNNKRTEEAKDNYSFINGAIQRYIDTLMPETRLFLDEDMHTKELDELVTVAHRFLGSYTVLNEYAALNQRYQESITRALSDLSQGTRNAFTWLFVPNEEKEVAQRAYDYLVSLKTGEYGASVERFTQELESLRREDAGTAWAAYRSNPDRVIDLFNQATPRMVYRIPDAQNAATARPFSGAKAQALVKQAKSAEKALSSIAAFSDEETMRKAVEKAANEMVAKEALSILGDIPVDELNRDKKGIRVGVLKDAGYMTVADLASASVYELASIRGISEDSAHTIKREYKAFSKRVLGTTKIRLSTDRKYKASSNLALATFSYLKKRELSRASSRLLDDNLEAIRSNADLLMRAGGEVGWLLAPASERNAAIAAFSALSALLSGPFNAECNAVFKSYSETVHAESDDAWRDFEQRPVEYINTLEDVVPDLAGSDGVYGLPEDLAREIQDECFFPEGLLCQLRRYQEWGVKYTLHQEKVLLGDEMGLGKTVQAIAAMVSLKNTGETHFMVVCPASVLSNWCREIRKMSLLRAIKVHGSDRDRALKHWVKAGGVAVTTYETTGRLKLNEGFKFGLLVVDEAHYIKNANAQRTKNVKKLCTFTDRLLFMTGTALENRVDEMVSLIDILQPEIGRKVRGIESLSSAPIFRELVAPVYYRRKREDVLTELPDLEESEEWCELGPAEQRAYEDAVFSRSFQDARRVSWNIDDMSKSSKANRLKELVEQAEAEGRKVLVFTYFLDTIRKVIDALGDRCVNPINGSVSPQRRQEIIDDFDSAPAGSVLVAQIQSGGTGLNIQSASVVVICEPQLKPSIENQAISRAYRMGQTRKVLVYRLLCEDTIDERITNILAEKQRIFNAFADKSVAAKESIELDAKTMGSLIDEEIERINQKKGRPAPRKAKQAETMASPVEAAATQTKDESARTPDRTYSNGQDYWAHSKRTGDKGQEWKGTRSFAVSRHRPSAAKSFVMPKGIQGGTLYVYDGKPVNNVRDEQEIIVDTILTPVTMTSSATGTTYEGDENSVCFTYQGVPVGFVGSKRAQQIREVAERHGAVSFWCTRDGDYMEGIPKLVPLFPDDAWFYADEEGILVQDDELCCTYSIADYCWTAAAPKLKNGERCRINLSITADGDNLSIRDGYTVIATVPEMNSSRAGLETAVDARFKAAWMDMKVMPSGYERKRICFVIDM